MPSAELTSEQRAALTTRSVSVALSAGAGCGKTLVLTERFLSHISPNAAFGESAGLHELIAITFTDAAAREMRTRIRDACYECLANAGPSGEKTEEWSRLLRLIETARISTIHSFCASLLRSHAVAAGLDPAFGVLEQGDADVLLSEVIDDALRSRLAEQDGVTMDLAAAYGLARVKHQLQTVLRARRAADFARWRNAAPKVVVAAWHSHYAEQALPAMIAAMKDCTAARLVYELLSEAVINDANKPKFAAARDRLLQLLPKLEDGLITKEELTEIGTLARVQSICSAKDWPTKEHYETYSAACKELRNTIDKYTIAPMDDAAALGVAALGMNLLHLADAVSREYAARKAAHGKLDFDDLLLKAHALITDPKNAALRTRLTAGIKLVLVDEFQDTDRVQVELIKAICGPGLDGGGLFFVGDFKQSIYRFRGAQPDVFHELREMVPTAGRLPLTENFRSQPAVLNFINALFGPVFGEGYEPLRPRRKQITQEPAVEFLWTPVPEKSVNMKGMADEARRQEAERIARRLRAFVENATGERPIVDRDTGQPRPLRPGDVAILFRALSDVQIYEEALRRYDLDYYLVGGHAFYAQQEIYDVLNLLRAVARPADQISLAGVLRSPFFALEDETIFWLAEAGNEEIGGWVLGAGDVTTPAPAAIRHALASIAPLNAGLFADPLPTELSKEEKQKVTFAAATIQHLRSIKDTVPITAVLNEALRRTGYDAVLLAEFLGQRKLANLHKLMERARAADAGGALDLDGFITQLSQFISHQPKEALAATAAETADVIRLMTIHQAKGLEFPMVIVPDLDRPPRLGPPPAAVDRDLGPLVPWPNDDENAASTIGMTLYAAREKAEELEERKRLLYVACTRAADYLILSSSLQSCDAPKSDWLKLLAKRFNLATGELIGENPAANERPQVRVTLDEPPTDHRPAGKTSQADLLELIADARQIADSHDAPAPPFVEPVPADLSARRQFSFSRLAGGPIDLGVDAETGPLDGTFATTPSLADFDEARGLGALVHDVLRRLTFVEFPNAAEVQEWCEHLAAQHVIQQAEQAAAKAAEMIGRFLLSPRGQELAKAAEIHQEVEFLLPWNETADQETECKKKRAGAPHSSDMRPQPYLRGYIDCLYRDDRGWHLVDFKTDDLASSQVASSAERHEMQLYLYALALESSLTEQPAELVVHFLRSGVEKVYSWNASARTRCKEFISDRIRKHTSHGNP
jgi:ATP-dependent helicase/nuclease subunit A